MGKPYSPNPGQQAAAKFRSTDELKDEVASLAAMPLPLNAPPAEEAPPEPGKNPKDHEEFKFSFKHVTKRGKVYEGAFTNRILTTGENQQVATLKARFAGGMPVESLEITTRTLNEAMAHMAYSFWSKDGQTFNAPDWARDLREILDQDVVFALWEEVWAHESHFFRLADAASESQS